MTRRQAAPPAQRWLLVIVALLAGPWLGQGAAFAYSVDVSTSERAGWATPSPSRSPISAPGASCTSTKTPVAGDRGCEEPTTLVFDVPESSVGRHEIRAYAVGVDGWELHPDHAVRVTGDARHHPPDQLAARHRRCAADVNVGEVGAPHDGRPAGHHRGRRSPSPSPSTTAAGRRRPTTDVRRRPAHSAPKAAPVGFAAGCKPRQVALMRFAVAPTEGRPGDAVSGSTSWGSVGTCSEKRALRVILDGKTVPGAPPDAGTSGKFEMTIPRDADPGPHTLALVADDDPSVELATIAFRVEKAKASIPARRRWSAAGAALLLVLLLLLVRRRRRRKRRRVPDDAWASRRRRAGAGAGSSRFPTSRASPSPSPTWRWRPPRIVVVEDQPTMPVVPLVVASGRHGSYYLLERQNPHAPRRANGKRGWYRDQRTQPIRGIAVALVEPHTAGAAASELATGERPASAHVVVDADGALDLLPDDVVAVHRGEHDEAALVMLLAGVGNDPATDEVVLGHAARWAAAKMREHAIPARLVTTTEFAAGEPGLVSDEHAFLWPGSSP